MDNPVLSFYTYDLEYIGTIGTYTSLQWENKMHSAGDIEIHIPIPYFNILGSTVSLDCFVKIERGVKEAYGVIHYIELSEDGTGKEECTIKGKTLSYLWSWRTPSLRYADEYASGSIKITKRNAFANFKTITESSYRVPGQSQFVDNLKFWDGITYVDKTDGSMYGFESSISDTHSILENYCKGAGLGYYCVPNVLSSGTKMIITVYTPQDNNRAIFDFARGNISKLTYSRANDGEKNGYYYLKKNENNIIENGKVVTTYNYDNILSNIGSRPKIVYCGSFESAEEAAAEGKKKMTDLTATESADGEIEIKYYDYIDDFNVGDIVTVAHSEWGISFKKVIYSVKETWENTYKCTATFGEPQDIVYKKLKKQLGR